MSSTPSQMQSPPIQYFLATVLPLSVPSTYCRYWPTIAFTLISARLSRLNFDPGRSTLDQVSLFAEDTDSDGISRPIFASLGLQGYRSRDVQYC